MMTFKELLAQALPDLEAPAKLADLPVRGLECDSRRVEKDFVFVAIRGVKNDGGVFIEEAMKRGAVAVIGQSDISARPRGTPFMAVPEARVAMARLASAFYGHPASKLRVVGITGTNGKTTTSYLIEHLLACAGRRVGVMGTVSYRFGQKEIPAVETTPGPLRAQEILSQMVADGCEDAVMEVSSHALDQKRVEGIGFEAALFTNLTQDHLDYHASLEAYFECKSRLFTSLAPEKPAVINIDDESGRRLVSMTPGRVVSYAVNREADFKASKIRPAGQATAFDLTAAGETLPVEIPLIGLHNVYNALGALAVVHALGLDLKKAIADLKSFKGVPGRLEAVRAGQNFMVFVDFAHTPDGLENVLKSLVPYKKKKLILVFGCGGDRDRDKRPRMAQIAARYADLVIVTSDNPRTEDPRVIAEAVRAGFPNEFKFYAVVLDRRKAIRQALLSARQGDIVLLAGKGHERCQIIGAEAQPFNDREEVERVLDGR